MAAFYNVYVMKFRDIYATVSKQTCVVEDISMPWGANAGLRLFTYVVVDTHFLNVITILRNEM